MLTEVINELYYPRSPYTFSVVEASVLGEIYELFLSEVIEIANDGTLDAVEKPEVRESGGVYATPRFIVDAIVRKTLEPIISDKNPQELAGVTVADICCGSGVFLLSVYEQLLNHCLEWHLSQKDSSKESREAVYEASTGNWRLRISAKRNVLVNHIRGVDIDPNAVEVAKFSLCLKLIEDESRESIVRIASQRSVHWRMKSR